MLSTTNQHAEGLVMHICQGWDVIATQDVQDGFVSIGNSWTKTPIQGSALGSMHHVPRGHMVVIVLCCTGNSHGRQT